jgi:methyl-accepting chemotaxis protein
MGTLRAGLNLEAGDTLEKMSNGDMTSRIEKDFVGDFTMIKTATNSVADKLQTIVGRINSGVSEISSASVQVNASSQSLSQGATEQASSLEESATALEEISSVMQNNSLVVKEMSALANEVITLSNDGEKLANKTAISMKEINEKVNAINEAIQVIDQIAFQTNILSLNAAVEAATAGEAGKGFAVVAGEVRNLAARSAEAANEIKKLVEIATSKTQEGTEISNSMISGYNELNNKITQTTQKIDIVAKSFTEQTNAINQINDNITHLGNDSQNNAQIANSIDQLSKEIEQLTQNLINTANKATFNHEAKLQVCDADLIYHLNRLKSDHINLKDEAFTKAGVYNKVQISKDDECLLGDWIKQMEQKRYAFTKTVKWQELKDIHKQLHNNIQEFVDISTLEVDNNMLFRIGDKTEESIIKIFELIDQIKQENCKKV